MLLILSILALFLGPVTYRLFQRQPGWLDLLDAFIFVTISGLVLFHILPELLHSGGLVVLPIMAIGLLIPSWIEKYFHKVANQAHQTTLFLGVFGLILHAAVDGSALSFEAGDQTAWLLALGVILHRFPVGLTVWWLLRPQYGRMLPLIILACMSAATAVGALFSDYTVLLNGELATWFQAFVMGSIMHVVLHRPYLKKHTHNQSHEHDNEEQEPEHRYAAGIGSLLGCIVLAAVLLPHWLGYIEHNHDHGTTTTITQEVESANHEGHDHEAAGHTEHKLESAGHGGHDHKAAGYEDHELASTNHEGHDHEVSGHEEHALELTGHEGHDHEIGEHEEHALELTGHEGHDHEIGGHEEHALELTGHEGHDHEIGGHEEHALELTGHEGHDHEIGGHEEHALELTGHEGHDHEIGGHEEHALELTGHEGHDHETNAHDSNTALTLMNVVKIALYSAPMLLFAYFLSALMHYFKPKFSLLPMQGSSNFLKDSLKGVAYGLPLPVCSPSATKMHQQLLGLGANQTFATAFLIATPIIGFDALLISLPLLGEQMLFLRLGLAIFFALSIAWLLGRHFTTPFSSIAAHSCQGGKPTSRFISAIKQGYQHQLDHTAPWVLFGWAVAATFSTLPSLSFFDQALGLQILVMIVIAFPFALCATGITPVLAILLMAGLSPGAAIAFFLIAPTISIDLLKTLNKQQGFFAAMSLALLMTVGAFLIGLLLNQYIEVISPTWLEQNISDYSLWQMMSLAVILVLYFSSLLRRGARSFIAELVPKSLLKHHHHH